METEEIDILSKEELLYSNLCVADKYDILEDIRLMIDEMDSQACINCRNKLKDKTLEALDDACNIWNPAPNNNDGFWDGEGNRTYVLRETNHRYDECCQLNFTQCEYDIHGSPNFDKVTFCNSIVDIHDLYDNYTEGQLKKRGGSRKSFQEVAQDRIAKQLEPTIREWWSNNMSEPYVLYDAFYEWRNSNNLVPHEDSNCRTMRLVYRPAHEVFGHRGGIANSINIKKCFG